MLKVTKIILHNARNRSSSGLALDKLPDDNELLTFHRRGQLRSLELRREKTPILIKHTEQPFSAAVLHISHALLVIKTLDQTSQSFIQLGSGASLYNF